MRRFMTAVCIVIAGVGMVYCAAIALPHVLSATGLASARADDRPGVTAIPVAPPLRPRTEDDIRRAEEAKLALTPKSAETGDDLPVPQGPGGPNNVCQQALPINDGTHPFSTIGATTDGPPLQPGCDTATQAFNDVWFNYFATCTGTLTVSTCGSADFDTVVVIYNSCACPLNSGQQIGCDDDTAGCANNTSTATAPVTAGQCFKIRIGAFGAAQTGSGTVTVSCSVIGPTTGACCRSNGNCTPETSANCTSLGGSFLGNGVLCTPSTCGGACCIGNGSCFQATSLDHCGGVDGRTMTFNTGCGAVTCPGAVNNDYVFAAAPLPEPPASATANIVMAREDEILACGPGVTNPGNSVWYSIVGTGHNLTASTCNPGTTFDTQVEIFCGPPDNLTCVGGNDDAAGAPLECSLGGLNRKSRVSFCSDAGRTYYISASGFGTAFGSFVMTVTSDGVTCGGAVSCPVATPICVACPADMNNDTVLNGLDVSPMVNCIAAGGGDGCGCGDLNGDHVVTPTDLPPFVNMLLAGSTPPCFRSMAFNTRATIVLQVDNPPLGQVALSMTNAGEGDTRVRLPDVPFVTGQPMPLELHLLELVGEHPVFGEVRLHLNRNMPQLGQLQNVVAGPGGVFVSGDVHFNVFFTLEIQNPQYTTAANNIPVHVFSTGNTQLPPNIPLTSEQPIPLTFSEPTINATLISVTHEVQKMCIYQVTCIDGPCNDCPVRLGDIVACFNCVNTCAGFQRKCGTKNCCVTYSVIDCRPPSGEPPCPPGDFCPLCSPLTGKCCLPDGTCITTTESECKDVAGPGGYRGDGTSCAPPQRCCLADGSCIDTDPECCNRAGGTSFAGICQPIRRCCIGNDSCRDLDPQCCVLQGGTPLPGTCQPSQKCCLPSGICVMADPLCCVNVLQGQSFPGACDQQKCCLPDGTCVDRDPQCCQIVGGVPHPGICNPQKCCLPNGTCVNRDPQCCLMTGGTSYLGVCNVQRCCLPAGVCLNLDSNCCVQIGGTSIAGTCVADQACCFNDGTCQMQDPQCCVTLGGTPRGVGSNCANPDVCKGACCHGNGTCTQTLINACTGASDSFKGFGTNCVNFKPNITGQPQSLTICENRTAVFTITATGTGTLHYQWTKNGGNVGGDSNTLTLNNVPLADDAATIVCTVKDDCGTQTSAPATLTVRATTVNAAFVAANATLNGPVAPSQVLGALTYGLTWEESITVTISADCTSGQWCAVMTGLVGNYSMQTRLLPGQTEVTGPPPGNSTQANFCLQVTNLDNLGNGPPAVAWYMLSAVVAHENVHLTRFEPGLESIAGVIEASFEGLCVPFTGQTREAAIAQIQALPAFAIALTNGRNAWFAADTPLLAGDHAAGGPCDVAEHGVVDPMVATICTHADANCWGPCARCPARTRGACCTGAACACTLPANCAGWGRRLKESGRPAIRIHAHNVYDYESEDRMFPLDTRAKIAGLACWRNES